MAFLSFVRDHDRLMKTIARIFAPETGVRVAIALLVLRLVAGWALHLHGMEKLQESPFHWLDRSPALSAAVPGVPPWLQGVVTGVESIGSLLLILGFLTPVAALLVICDLGTAVLRTGIMQGHPFVGRPDPFELPALLLLFAITLLIAGPGRYSIDALIAGRARTTREIESPMQRPSQPAR